MADMLSQIESLNDTLAISDIDFKFVIHSDNQLFCIIIVDQEPVAEIAFDGNRSPMEGLKNWFERILLPFYYGERCPEFIDIYSNGGRARLIMAHSGWETVTNGKDGKAYHVPTSLFAIHYKGDSSVRIWCFCQTQQFVERFYRAITNALEAYQDLFNDVSFWHFHTNYSRRARLLPAAEIKQEMESRIFKLIMLSEPDQR